MRMLTNDATGASKVISDTPEPTREASETTAERTVPILEMDAVGPVRQFTSVAVVHEVVVQSVPDKPAVAVS